jgi:hypothetical protein
MCVISIEELPGKSHGKFFVTGVVLEMGVQGVARGLVFMWPFYFIGNCSQGRSCNNTKREECPRLRNKVVTAFLNFMVEM